MESVYADLQVAHSIFKVDSILITLSPQQFLLWLLNLIEKMPEVVAKLVPTQPHERSLFDL
jgi:hypothetical protein